MDYSKGLKLIRSRRQLRWLELPGFILMMSTVLWIFNESVAAALVVFLLFTTLAVAYNYKVIIIECPKCNKPFGKDGWFMHSFNQKCSTVASELMPIEIWESHNKPVHSDRKGRAPLPKVIFWALQAYYHLHHLVPLPAGDRRR